MLNLSNKLKMSVLAIVAALSLAAFATPASAHTSRIECNRWGNHCYRIVCNDRGYNCRRVSIDRGNRYRERYDRDGYRDRDYSGRRQVCDRRGDRCYWVSVDRDGYYRDRNGVYLRIQIP